MQTIFIVLSLMCFWTNTLFADEKPPAEPIKVETLITEIKSAKPENRRALMNQLKLRLRVMNRSSRAKAMMNLKQSFRKSGSHQQARKSHNGMKHQEKPQHTGQRGIHKGMHQGQQKGRK